MQDYGSAPYIKAGTAATRPATPPSRAGFIYVETDTGMVYQVVPSGSSFVWVVMIAGAPGVGGIAAQSGGNVAIPAATAQTTLITRTIGDASVETLEAHVIAMTAGGVLGGYWRSIATFQRSGGAVTQMGTTTALVTQEGVNGAATIDFNVSGLTVQLRLQNPGTDALAVVRSTLLVRSTLVA